MRYVDGEITEEGGGENAKEDMEEAKEHEGEITGRGEGEKNTLTGKRKKEKGEREAKGWRTGS